MKAIVETETGAILRVCVDTEGHDLTGCTVMDVPEGYDPIAISHLVVGGEWVLNDASAFAQLRVERDARLLACDWTQLPDVPDPTRLAWAPYRQALRDLPETTTDPFAPQWPQPPEE